MAKNIKTIAKPDANAVNDALLRTAQLSINCCHIGIIQKFTPETQIADIKIVYKQVVSVEEDGTKTLQEYPVLMQCPVLVLFGGVDVLTMPIKEGDSCLVLFNDRNIDQWLVNGSDAPPQDSRLHDLSDGIAIVGIRPLTNSITNYLANGIRLSHGVGNSQIDLKDDLIDSIADMFFHHGNMTISGNLSILGDVYGNGLNNLHLRTNLTQENSYSLHAGNGATGTFDVVTVVDGIVVGGS